MGLMKYWSGIWKCSDSSVPLVILEALGGGWRSSEIVELWLRTTGRWRLILPLELLLALGKDFKFLRSKADRVEGSALLDESTRMEFNGALLLLLSDSIIESAIGEVLLRSQLSSNYDWSGCFGFVVWKCWNLPFKKVKTWMNILNEIKSNRFIWIFFFFSFLIL